MPNLRLCLTLSALPTTDNPNASAPGAEFTDPDEERPNLADDRRRAPSPARIRKQARNPLDIDPNALAKEQQELEEHVDLSDREGDEARLDRRKLTREPKLATEGRVRFIAFGHRSFSQTATFSIASASGQWGIRRMQNRAMWYFLADLGEGEILFLRAVKIAIEFPDLFEDRYRRNSADGPVYEEICIPARMTKWRADVGALSFWIRPVRDRRNAISPDLARCRQTRPIYVP